MILSGIGDAIIRRQLKYEIADTSIAMLVGWAINSAIIIVAAATFHHNGIAVSQLQQAEATLRPLLGNAASAIFAIALILSGVSSSITASMAGGSIFAGIFGEPFDIADRHSQTGILITLLGGLCIIFFLGDPFTGLIWSQIVLSIQLPWSIAGMIALTSSKRVMGKYRNSPSDLVILIAIAVVVSALNVFLLLDISGIWRV